MSGHRRFQKPAIQNNCIELISDSDFRTGDFPQHKFWTCSTMKPRAFGNCARLSASGFGLSFTGSSRAPSPRSCRSLAFIGTGGGSFGSIRAASFAPPLGLTRATSIPPFTRRISHKGAPPMKRSKRRLPVPQHEFFFAPQAFNLFTEERLDGERIIRERAEADRARRAAEAAQARLFTSQNSK